jgi:NDP-sugar pyrophosphorylase family protein
MSESPLKVLVLAGGRGRRLAPYTSVLPKPLMPIGDRSILETLVGRLTSQGFTDITLCVGYLSHLIRAVADQLPTDISFVQELEPLGTAAPMRLVDGLDDTFVAMNGDVLTTLDLRDLVASHREGGNVMTIATVRRVVKIDYGVLHVAAQNGSGPRGGAVVAFEEKPEIASTVSMGIYVLEPRALDYIPAGRHFDVPELVQALLDAGERVGAFLFDGVWFDIGRSDDYEKAVDVWLSMNETADDDSPAFPLSPSATPALVADAITTIPRPSDR